VLDHAARHELVRPQGRRPCNDTVWADPIRF
jgi:hypothetical protein